MQSEQNIADPTVQNVRTFFNDFEGLNGRRVL